MLTLFRNCTTWLMGHYAALLTKSAGFYPDYTDGSKKAENSKSLFATIRRT